MTIHVAVRQDGAGILDITARAGVFDPEEVACVGELWEEYLQKGSEASGYTFLVYRSGEKVWGFACFGARALTQGTYDLYWIATDPDHRRNGVGQDLLQRVEQAVRDLGGRLIVVETSGVEKYAPTQRFYLATGYNHEATLRDFYQTGDDLVIFTKHV